MDFTIYDPATGRIKRWGMCPDDDFELQAGEGDGLIEGHYRDDTHYIVAGAAVAFPPKPAGGVWDWAGLTWEIDLAPMRAAKWEQMKLARQATMTQPLVTPYGTFDADKASRDNIIQTAQLMQTEAQTLSPADVPTVDFTLADNTAVTLSAGQMVDVALLLAAQVQGAYARGRVVRQAIAAATTASELEAIQWAE